MRISEDKVRRDLVSRVLVWGMVVAIGSAIISCEEPIKPFFKDKVTTREKRSKLVEQVKSVAYKYNDKIVFSWAKVKNAASYYVYEFKQRTGTVASRGENPDDIVGSHVTKYTIKISRKERKRMNTRYVIVQARDKEGKVLFESEMKEGKTLGNPIVIEEAGHVEETFYSITFQWASVEGASKYSVERKEKGASYTAMSLPKRMGKSWEFVDEEVAVDTQYAYKITAIVMSGAKVVGKSEYEFSAKTAKQEAPSAVKSFEASEYVYGDRVLLVWEEPDAVEGFNQEDLHYTIQRREKRADNAKRFESIGLRMKSSELTKPAEESLRFEEIFEGRSAQSLVYQDKDVEVGHEYEYRVIASYEVNKKLGEPSEVIRGAVIPQAKNVRAAQSDDGVRISWEVPSDFSGTVEVHRSVGGLAFEKIADGITGVEYTNRGISLETSYWYKVRLVAAIENVSEFHRGEFSAEVEYRYEKEKEREFNFTVSSGKRRELKFIWDIPDDILESEEVKGEAFSIKRLADDGETFENVVLSTPVSIDREKKKGEAGLAVDTSSFTSGLYRVVWNRAGEKHYSEVVKGDILRAPEGVRATEGEYAERIEVKWKPSVGAKKYEVSLWRSRFSGGKDPWMKIHNVEVAERVDEYTLDIKPPENDNPKFRGIAYDIRVDAIGEDENIDRAQSTVVLGKTFGPGGMDVQATEGSSREKITITWNAVENADTYLVVRKMKGTSAEFEIAMISAEEGKRSYTYDDLVEDPQYLTDDVPLLEKIYFQEYEYRVEPKRRGVQSLVSVEAVGCVLGTPRDLEASTTYGDKIVVSWKHVGGAKAYKIYASDERDAYYEYRATITETDAGEGIGQSIALGTDIQYEDNSHVLKQQGTRYYKVVSVNEEGIESRMPEGAEGFARGELFSSVSGVQASDINFEEDTGSIYVAKHGDAVGERRSRSERAINRSAEISYATKITWDSVSGADVYYIYRMDFNELENFWRKIGERDADDEAIFFDTNALLLREYRAMYWVVAGNRDKNGRLHFDISLHGDPKRKPTNTLIAKTMEGFSRFNAGRQNENIEAMSEASNVDVGSRWITAKEYLNWSIAVIGEAVYDLDYDESSYGYGSSRDSWRYIVNFTLENYSLGAKALNLRDREERNRRKRTELMVLSRGALSGTFTEDEDDPTKHDHCPNGNGGVSSCRGATAFGRLGTYIGNRGASIINSPYGIALLQISGTGSKDFFGFDVDTENGLVYDFRGGSLTFTWVTVGKITIGGEVIAITKEDNTGIPGPLNPFVTPIRFNRNYATFLRAVYGSKRG